MKDEHPPKIFFNSSNKIQNWSVIIDILQNVKPIVKPKTSIESVDTKPISFKLRKSPKTNWKSD